jgi:polyphosphate kinase
MPKWRWWSVRNWTDCAGTYIGTGNYNPITARIYTDLSYFTCREDITNDATEVFNFLTGYSQRESYTKLIVAPINLRKRMIELIRRETQHARNGKPAHLVFKINSLTDIAMIETLYEASREGVKIELIVRGVCSLRPGIKGASDNIRAISIVGRFLEHSRVFYFANDGKPELYLSSADLMGRNLDRRVELMFPIEDATWADAIKQEVLDTALQDTMRARVLSHDGSYNIVTPSNGEKLIESQSAILQMHTKVNSPRVVPTDTSSLTDRQGNRDGKFRPKEDPLHAQA